MGRGSTLSETLHQQIVQQLQLIISSTLRESGKIFACKGQLTRQPNPDMRGHDKTSSWHVGMRKGWLSKLSIFIRMVKIRSPPCIDEEQMWSNKQQHLTKDWFHNSQFYQKLGEISNVILHSKHNCSKKQTKTVSLSALWQDSSLGSICMNTLQPLTPGFCNVCRRKMHKNTSMVLTHHYASAKRMKTMTTLFCDQGLSENKRPVGPVRLHHIVNATEWWCSLQRNP